MAQRIELPRGAKKWLKENYANTPNSEILERYGIKKGVLERLARELHLKKSEEYMRMARERGVATCKAKGWPPKGYVIPNREKAWESLPERVKNRGEEWKENVSAAVSKHWKDEKRRVLFGLEQKSTRKVTRAPKQKYNHRWHMRKLGYIISRCGNVAYWNAETKRSVSKENIAQRYGIRVEPIL